MKISNMTKNMRHIMMIINMKIKYNCNMNIKYMDHIYIYIYMNNVKNIQL